ncbi:MAG: hypothetical protein AAB701_01555 [Patescibacteria group bacterium]
MAELSPLDQHMNSWHEQAEKKNPFEYNLGKFFAALKRERGTWQAYYEASLQESAWSLFPGDLACLRMQLKAIEFLDVLEYDTINIGNWLHKLHRNKLHKFMTVEALILLDCTNGDFPEGTELVEQHLAVLREKLAALNPA